MSPEWWNISRPSGDSTRVDLYDGIGSDDSQGDFLRALQGIKTPKIDLHINSDGGDITAGIAVFNALKSHTADVTATIDSLAASISSVIALGADKIVMAPEAFMMIHNGMMIIGGGADKLRSAADSIEKMTNTIAGVYAERTKRPIDEIKAAMTKETWFDAAEAKAFGLCDEIGGASNSDIPTSTMQAVMRMQNVPEKLRQYAARLVAGREPETPMNPAKCYEKDGKFFAEIEGKMVEIDLPRAQNRSTQDQPAAVVGQLTDVERKAQLDQEIAKAKLDGQNTERQYRETFDTVVKTAGIEGEQLGQFTKLFYGQSKDILTFHATNLMAGRAKAVGEGDGGAGGASKTEDEKAYEKLVSGSAKRWAQDRPLRRLCGCMTDDVDAPEYKAKYQRWLKAEIRCVADQKHPPSEFNEGGDDPISRVMRNKSVLIDGPLARTS